MDIFFLIKRLITCMVLSSFFFAQNIQSALLPDGKIFPAQDGIVSIPIGQETCQININEIGKSGNSVFRSLTTATGLDDNFFAAASFITMNGRTLTSGPLDNYRHTPGAPFAAFLWRLPKDENNVVTPQCVSITQLLTMYYSTPSFFKELTTDLQDHVFAKKFITDLSRQQKNPPLFPFESHYSPYLTNQSFPVQTPYLPIFNVPALVHQVSTAAFQQGFEAGQERARASAMVFDKVEQFAQSILPHDESSHKKLSPHLDNPVVTPAQASPIVDSLAIHTGPNSNSPHSTRSGSISSEDQNSNPVSILEKTENPAHPSKSIVSQTRPVVLKVEPAESKIPSTPREAPHQVQQEIPKAKQKIIKGKAPVTVTEKKINQAKIIAETLNSINAPDETGKEDLEKEISKTVHKKPARKVVAVPLSLPKNKKEESQLITAAIAANKAMDNPATKIVPEAPRQLSSTKKAKILAKLTAVERLFENLEDDEAEKLLKEIIATDAPVWSIERQKALINYSDFLRRKNRFDEGLKTLERIDSTIIKEDKEFEKKKYGVEALLVLAKEEVDDKDVARVKNCIEKAEHTLLGKLATYALIVSGKDTSCPPICLRDDEHKDDQCSHTKTYNVLKNADVIIAWVECGRILMQGLGCQKNVPAGLKLIKQAAHANSSEGLCALALYHYDKKEFPEALECIKKANIINPTQKIQQLFFDIVLKCPGGNLEALGQAKNYMPAIAQIPEEMRCSYLRILWEFLKIHSETIETLARLSLTRDEALFEKTKESTICCGRIMDCVQTNKHLLPELALPENKELLDTFEKAKNIFGCSRGSQDIDGQLVPNFKSLSQAKAFIDKARRKNDPIMEAFALRKASVLFDDQQFLMEAASRLIIIKIRNVNELMQARFFGLNLLKQLGMESDAETLLANGKEYLEEASIADTIDVFEAFLAIASRTFEQLPSESIERKQAETIIAKKYLEGFHPTKKPTCTCQQDECAHTLAEPFLRQNKGQAFDREGALILADLHEKLYDGKNARNPLLEKCSFKPSLADAENLLRKLGNKPLLSIFLKKYAHTPHEDGTVRTEDEVLKRVQESTLLLIEAYDNGKNPEEEFLVKHSTQITSLPLKDLHTLLALWGKNTTTEVVQKLYKDSTSKGDHILLLETVESKLNQLCSTDSTDLAAEQAIRKISQWNDFTNNFFHVFVEDLSDVQVRTLDGLMSQSIDFLNTIGSSHEISDAAYSRWMDAFGKIRSTQLKIGRRLTEKFLEEFLAGHPFSIKEKTQSEILYAEVRTKNILQKSLETKLEEEESLELILYITTTQNNKEKSSFETAVKEFKNLDSTCQEQLQALLYQYAELRMDALQKESLENIGTTTVPIKELSLLYEFSDALLDSHLQKSFRTNLNNFGVRCLKAIQRAHSRDEASLPNLLALETIPKLMAREKGDGYLGKSYAIIASDLGQESKLLHLPLPTFKNSPENTNPIEDFRSVTQTFCKMAQEKKPEEDTILRIIAASYAKEFGTLVEHYKKCTEDAHQTYSTRDRGFYLDTLSSILSACIEVDPEIFPTDEILRYTETLIRSNFTKNISPEESHSIQDPRIKYMSIQIEKILTAVTATARKFTKEPAKFGEWMNVVKTIKKMTTDLQSQVKEA